MDKDILKEIKNTSAYRNYEETKTLKPIDNLLEQRANLIRMKDHANMFKDIYILEIKAVEYLLTLHK